MAIWAVVKGLTCKNHFCQKSSLSLPIIAVVVYTCFNLKKATFRKTGILAYAFHY